jgi:hypothetical protein
MTNSLRIVGLAGALVVVLATSSPALSVAQPNNAVAERQPVVTELGTNASAITYWVSESDGWHVVTTVDIAFAQEGDAEKHAVVRFSSVLLPGQSQLISVPVALGKQQQVLWIRRLDNRIQVERVPGV